MDLPKQQRAALAAAINAAGSAAELARRLGISPEAVCQWKGKVPVNRVIAVEAATGVQLEPGSAVTDFEVIAVDDEMFRCQRYYETGLGTIAIAYIPSPGWNMANSFGFKVTKRTTPTITTTFGTLHTTNANGVVLYATMNSAPEQDNLTFTAAAEI